MGAVRQRHTAATQLAAAVRGEADIVQVDRKRVTADPPEMTNVVTYFTGKVPLFGEDACIA